MRWCTLSRRGGASRTVAGQLAVAGDDRAVHDARRDPDRLGDESGPAGRHVGHEANVVDADAVGVEEHEVGVRAGRDAAAVADAEQLGLAAGEHRDRGLERQHAALADPVLQRPHRVAAVGVALRVRAGVAAAELRGRVRDELAEPVVVGAAHRDRELRLEVVGDRDLDQHVDRIVALRRRRSSRCRGRGGRRCAASSARARGPSGR